DVERVEELRRSEDAHGPLRERVEAVHRAAAVPLAAELIDGGKERLAVAEAVGGDALQDEIVTAFAHRTKGVVAQAEKTGAWLVVRLVLRDVAEADEGRNAGKDWALQSRRGGADMWPAAAGGVGGEMARAALVAGVVVAAADDRADRHQLVHDASHVGKQLA